MNIRLSLTALSVAFAATAHGWTVTDLNPSGSSYSQANGASGANQAGLALVGGILRASFWSGTAASWFDLSAFLPSGFTDSYALSMSTDGVNDYIGGYGLNASNGQYEALLWTQPAPEPCSSAALGLGAAALLRRRRR